MRRVRKGNFKKFFRKMKKRKFLVACALVFVLFLFVVSLSDETAYTYRSFDERAYLKVLRARYSGSKRGVSPQAAREYIADACEFAATIQSEQKWNTKDVRELLLRTACVETNLRPRFQDSSGDAIGLFQIEYGTFRDLWKRAIPVKYAKLYRAIVWRFGDAVDGKLKFEDLQKHDTLCALFALVKYIDSGKNPPSYLDVRAQAHFYKEIYNTEAGKGNVEKFINTAKYLNDNYQ